MAFSSKQSFSQFLKLQLAYQSTQPSLTALLTGLDYPDEVALKTTALQQFWNSHKFPLQPAPLLPSPRSRHYRSTSKRRVRYQNHRYRLFRTDEESDGSDLLEAESHAVLYNFFQQEFNRPVNYDFSRRIHYVIIRGSAQEPSIILNIDQFNAPIVRRAKAIAEKLRQLPVHVFSAFLYLDPTRSHYYLESKRPASSMTFKKLFGPDLLYIKILDKIYCYSPLCFSQVNESMVPQLLKKAEELLLPQPGHRLIDLYCGYGLFSHYLAAHCAEVIGMEFSSAAIYSAVTNKRFLNPEIPMRFIAKSIDRVSLSKSLPHPDHTAELLLLDPPYQGTNPGVIQELTCRNCERILHIFCNMDALSHELGDYVKNGYNLKRVVPLDLFPGTPNLEILLLFSRA